MTALSFRFRFGFGFGLRFHTVVALLLLLICQSFPFPFGVTALTTTTTTASTVRFSRAPLASISAKSAAASSMQVSNTMLRKTKYSRSLLHQTNRDDASPSSQSPDGSSQLASSSFSVENYQQQSMSLSTDDNDNNSANGSSNNTSNSSQFLGVPSYKSILIFTSTTILIWLSEPLLSLVDTTVVGLKAQNSVVQLAALGPATMLIDSLVYLTYFLAIATTSTMAKSLAKNDCRELQKTASQVMGVATGLGVLMTTIVFTMGRPLLYWMAGSSRSPELITLALRYAQIRSSVAPLAILGMVAQAICLACLDTKTPALAVIAASVVNLVGDLYLVGTCHMGIQGAAIATAIASVASTVILLKEVQRKMNHWHQQSEWIKTGNALNGSNKVATNTRVVNGTPILNQTLMMQDLDRSSTTVNVTTTTTTTKADQQKNHLPTQVDEDEAPIPFISFPDRVSTMQLCKLAGPIFFVICGKLMCYSAMTLRVADFGMVALASHNIMMRIFFFYATFGDSLSQAAQSYLPQVVFAKKNKKKNKKAIQTLLTRLGILSAGIGIFNLNMARWILQHCGKFFTTNQDILAMMEGHSTFMSLALLLDPFIMTFEGAMIATQDLTYLVVNYCATMALLLAQLKFVSQGFTGVWKSLFIFQIIRLVQFGTRVWRKLLQNGKQSKTTSSPTPPPPLPSPS